MARTLKESRLTTRSARAALPEGLHWRGIDVDIHLGYRKSSSGGRWLARYYVPEGLTYRRIPLGVADDLMAEGTLSFEAAVKLARTKVAELRHGKAALAAVAEEPRPTIRSAVEAYIEIRNERILRREGRALKSDAASRLQRHVLSDRRFADTRLGRLSQGEITKWRQRLDPKLKDTSRKRLFNDLKAALNAAFRDHRRHFPADFPELVRHSLRVEHGSDEHVAGVRENQILSDTQVREIIEAAVATGDDDFARMVVVLAATGARFSQVRRMKVADVQLERKRLLVPTSRKGRAKAAGSTAVQVGNDVLQMLEPVTKGRGADEPLLFRWRHVQTGPATWKRDRRGSWTSASEMTRQWQAICETLDLKGVVPYALRHSSIVRGVRAGLPIRLVAALHDTSVAMIERHYSRWIVDGLEELAARAVVPLVGGQSDRTEASA